MGQYKNKRYEKIINKLHGKDVIIYGAGKFFNEIMDNYDLSEINIIGITDIKFLPEDEGNLYKGFKIIPYCKFNPYELKESILIILENPKNIIKSLKKSGAKKIISLVDTPCIFNPFKKFFHKPNNKLVLIKTNGKKIFNPRIKNLTVKFWGDNNYIEIHEPFRIRDKVYLSCNSNSKVVINDNNYYKNAEILLGSNNTLIIGKNTTLGTDVRLILRGDKNKKIVIGEDCQLGWNITVRTQDAHVVYDAKTKELLNPAKDIYIGNHVWIAANTTLLKGSEIPSNCVIGTNSLINKKFTQENCIIAGNPAKIVKQSINWDRRDTSSFSNIAYYSD